MEKFKGYQILKLLAIVAFLIITPLLSTSLRRTYLYIVLNLVIIALGLESGLLSSIKPIEAKNPSTIALVQHKPKADEGRKPPTTQTQRRNYQEGVLLAQTQRFNYQEDVSPDRPLIFLKATKTGETEGDAPGQAKPRAKVVQKCSSEKIVGSLSRQKVKKCPSTPSLFFIGGSEEFVEDDGKELFHKAETFIGNFYKQLKMQREDSWKKLQDLYTIKPFKSHIN